MKLSACCAIALLFCMSLRASAQVANNSAESTSSNSTPKVPSYTPEQLFGTSAAPTSSGNSVVTQTAPPTPQLPERPSTVDALPVQPGRSCSTVAKAAPNDPRFPGVSASQFQRAGVSADAFTRPGVSTEQLSVLAPGGGPRPCQPTGDVVLYPEPERQPRPIPAPVDQP